MALSEMDAFDQLPRSLRRAIDESTWNVCALLTLAAVRCGRTTFEAAERRVRGIASWQDARDYFNWLQDTVWGTRRYHYI